MHGVARRPNTCGLRRSHTWLPLEPETACASEPCSRKQAVNPDELVTLECTSTRATTACLTSIRPHPAANCDSERTNWKGFYDHHKVSSRAHTPARSEFRHQRAGVLPQRGETAGVAKQVTTLAAPRAGPGRPRGGDRVERRRVRRWASTAGSARNTHRGAVELRGSAEPSVRPCPCRDGRRHRHPLPG